jgi:hypothetical protein
MPGIQLVLGGVAVVCCVHDRQKRQVRNPDDYMRLLVHGRRLVGATKFQTCGCCENVFVALSDIPQLCHQCNGSLRHKPGGPISDPIEGVL